MLCYMWWNDMFTIWYVNIEYVWWHARDMICEFYDMVWYDTLENMISLWYDICSDMNDIWYDWYPIWWIDIMHDPIYTWKAMIKWYDTKENTRGVVIHYNERKNVETSWIIVCSSIKGYPIFFYDGMNAYTTRQGNDHYVYYNVATVAIPNGCPASIAPRECSPDKKGIVGSPKGKAQIGQYLLAVGLGRYRYPGGVQTNWWVHTCTCGPLVE